jgi:hypothetical protein
MSLVSAHELLREYSESEGSMDNGSEPALSTDSPITGNEPMLKRWVMTDYERGLIRKLWTCSFLPGSFDKRFVRSLYSQIAQSAEQPELTNKQHAYLAKLEHKYRRQLLGRPR